MRFLDTVPNQKTDYCLKRGGHRHPIDLVVSKIVACLSREQKRDYEDMAEAIKAWPE
ncbi:MAG: hypothetical protein OXG56_12655 [Gammaproteobacteria bacterium]|nr:hypothetical protein [Gammaproteobacteria bacterium]